MVWVCPVLDEPGPRSPAARSVEHLTPWLIALGLFALVAAVYANVGGLGFVNFDDPRYVTQNAHVRAGLTREGVAWAFTTMSVANWHPLTWLSHMVDVQLFGLDPGWHHWVSVLLHCCNAVLLFAALKAATGATWRSAVVAALFGVHPLHVESVAWISERKDMLSTLFWLAGTLAYVRYARQPGAGRFLPVAGAMALGLLAKPMVMTLPLVLLLLDVWPLGRVPAGAPLVASFRPLVREKLPLFALSATSAAFTFVAQRRGGAVNSLDVLSVGTRIENAVVSYASYLAKAFWPVNLAAVYPHPGLGPGGISPWKVAGAVLLLAGITGVAVWQRKRRPYLLIGWLWYVVTLVPVIGFVQIGLQGMADRYTYVPLVGIFIGLTWLAADLAGEGRARRALAISAAIAALVLCAGLARRQVGTWRDSFTLFEHALAVTEDNGMAWRNLGTAYVDAHQYPVAIAALRESLRLLPYDARTWMNLAIAQAAVGQFAESDEGFAKALRMNPNDPFVWFNLGIAEAMQGRWDRVAEAQLRLRELNPELADDLEGRLQRAR